MPLTRWLMKMCTSCVLYQQSCMGTAQLRNICESIHPWIVKRKERKLRSFCQNRPSPVLPFYVCIPVESPINFCKKRKLSKTGIPLISNKNRKRCFLSEPVSKPYITNFSVFRIFIDSSVDLMKTEK